MTAIARLRGRDPDTGTRRRTTPTQFFRYLPGDSPVHHLWAGTKLLAVAALGVALSLDPSWVTEGVIAGALIVIWLLARIPLSVVPRLPRWFWLGIGVSVVLSLISGGSPNVHLGPVAVGLGSLEITVRLFVFSALLLMASALVAWTTPLAEVAPALSKLLAPFRVLRLPVDELVVTLGLSIRCLPLLIDELRTLYAARRVRRPVDRVANRGADQLVNDGIDLLVSALVTATRRAREMGEAMDARGGLAQAPKSPQRPHLVDAGAVLVIAALVTGALLV